MLIVVCMFCKSTYARKPGYGVSGVSHGVCPVCEPFAMEWLEGGRPVASGMSLPERIMPPGRGAAKEELRFADAENLQGRTATAGKKSLAAVVQKGQADSPCSSSGSPSCSWRRPSNS